MGTSSAGRKVAGGMEEVGTPAASKDGGGDRGESPAPAVYVLCLRGKRLDDAEKDARRRWICGCLQLASSLDNDSKEADHAEGQPAGTERERRTAREEGPERRPVASTWYNSALIERCRWTGRTPPVDA
jgi:hypothetical protein